MTKTLYQELFTWESGWSIFNTKDDQTHIKYTRIKCPCGYWVKQVSVLNGYWVEQGFVLNCSTHTNYVPEEVICTFKMIVQ